MNKELFVDGISFKFFFDEPSNMWRLIESSYLIENNAIDIEIDLNNFNGDLNWDDLAKFIKFIRNTKQILNAMEDAKYVLLAFFKTIYKGCDFLNHIDFNLSGINYRGCSKNVNLTDSFEFDFFFFPYYTKDIYRDIGSFVWLASFRDSKLLGVYCNRI